MNPVAGSDHTPALTVMQVVPQLNMGGVERGTVEFAHYLKQAGHRSVVVSHGGSMVPDLVRLGVEHVELNVSKKSLLSLLSIRKLRRLIQTYQVDVLHARSRLPAWLSYWAVNKLSNDRPAFVTTLHGLHSVNRYSSVMARGDQVIAVSDTAKTYLQQNFTQYLKQAPVVIYRGIDEQFVYRHQPDATWLQSFRSKLADHATTKTVLMPGRLSRLKGVEHLLGWLQAAPKTQKLLLTARPDESRYSRKVHQLFQQHQVSDQVIWLGVERQMADLYAAVDLVVSVNKKAESFGRTVLEALSVGTPVVAFDLGGVHEIMAQLYPDGLITAGDSDQLAKKIEQFLHQAPEVKPHDGFKNSRMFQATVAVYQQLMRDRHA